MIRFNDEEAAALVLRDAIKASLLQDSDFFKTGTTSNVLTQQRFFRQHGWQVKPGLEFAAKVQAQETSRGSQHFPQSLQDAESISDASGHQSFYSAKSLPPQKRDISRQRPNKPLKAVARKASLLTIPGALSGVTTDQPFPLLHSKDSRVIDNHPPLSPPLTAHSASSQKQRHFSEATDTHDEPDDASSIDRDRLNILTEQNLAKQVHELEEENLELRNRQISIESDKVKLEQQNTQLQSENTVLKSQLSTNVSQALNDLLHTGGTITSTLNCLAGNVKSKYKSDISTAAGIKASRNKRHRKAGNCTRAQCNICKPAAASSNGGRIRKEARQCAEREASFDNHYYTWSGTSRKAPRIRQ